MEVGPATEGPRERASATRMSPADIPDPCHPQPMGPVPPATPSEQTSISEIGFVPEISPAASTNPSGADSLVRSGPPGPAQDEGHF